MWAAHVLAVRAVQALRALRAARPVRAGRALRAERAVHAVLSCAVLCCAPPRGIGRAIELPYRALINIFFYNNNNTFCNNICVFKYWIFNILC